MIVFLSICINCAGIHRNLGVHISKVRSIDLDTSCWDPNLIDFMLSIGNKRAHSVYAKFVPSWYIRPMSPLASDPVILRRPERRYL
jgi:stromal membrane-associated protein